MTLKQLTHIVMLANELGASYSDTVYFNSNSREVTLPLLEAKLTDYEISEFAELGVCPTQEGKMSFFI